MTLRVEHIYGHATVQGAPVSGRRRFGVPPGGAFDPGLQARLNAGVGNPADTPVLELALCQLTLRALGNVALAWSGNSNVLIDGIAMLPEVTYQAVSSDSIITFDVPRFGARTWVAACGGFGLAAGMLKRGDVLTVNPGKLPLEVYIEPVDGLGRPSGLLHAMPGRSEFQQLFKNRYTVRHDSDRVGIRLEGPRMAHILELPSEPATPGVVQITPEGFPIILGPDGPTIGGYPRAAVVISGDLPALAQLRPGDEIQFERVGT